MEDLNVLLNLLRSDGSIIVNKSLARNIGIEAAIMFSELISKQRYFEEKGQIQNGYFFNTVENMEYDTTLSDYQQRKAIKKLKSLKLIEYYVHGLPATRYFKITENVEILNKYLSSSEKTKELDVKKLQNLSEKTKELDVKKLQSNNTNTNNTNTNNTNNNTKVNGGATSAPVSFFEKNIQIVTQLFDNSPLEKTKKDEINKAIIYYLNQYLVTFNQPHPVIRRTHWTRIINRLSTSDFTDFDIMQPMIDKYFITEFNYNVDYNILHFATDGILENRFEEIGR